MAPAHEARALSINHTTANDRLTPSSLFTLGATNRLGMSPPSPPIQPLSHFILCFLCPSAAKSNVPATSKHHGALLGPSFPLPKTNVPPLSPSLPSGALNLKLLTLNSASSPSPTPQSPPASHTPTAPPPPPIRHACLAPWRSHHKACPSASAP